MGEWLHISLSSYNPLSIILIAPQALTFTVVPPRKTRAEHDRIQKITIQSDERRNRAIVERAGKGRDKIQFSCGAPLQKAASGYLNNNLNQKDFFVHSHWIYEDRWNFRFL